jgi:uncharacterized protein involved in exopolysaccharide biosynthesis
MLLWVAMTLAGTAAIIVWWPRSYESRAQLLVRMGRENVMLDPTATTGQTINLHRTRESEINSVIQIIKSDQIAHRVLERIDAATIVRGRRGESAQEGLNPIALLRAVKSSLVGIIQSLDPLDEQEQAIRKFRSSLKVSSPMDSNVVAIHYVARSPQFAHEVAQLVTEVFVEENLQLNRTVGSYKFYQGQEVELRGKLDEALRELSGAKNESGLASVVHHQEALERRLATVQEWLSTNHAELAATQAKVEALQKNVDSSPLTVTTSTVSGFGNDAREGMRQQLYDLEIKEGELISRYTSDHPKVVGVRQQRLEAERILNSYPDDRTQTSTGLNPVRQQADIDLLAEIAHLSSLQSKEETLNKELADVRTQMAALNQHEVKIAQLQTEVDLTRIKYEVLTEKLEQARIVDALEHQQITSVNVVQPATLEKYPVRPQKGLTLVLGLAAALGGAFVVAVIAEYFDRSLATSAVTQGGPEIPLFVSIGRPGQSAPDPSTT